jgi:hypothetical protein
MLTPQFWLLWLMLVMNVSCGIGVIGQVRHSDDSHTHNYHRSPHWSCPLHYQAQQNGLVSHLTHHVSHVSLLVCALTQSPPKESLMIQEMFGKTALSAAGIVGLLSVCNIAGVCVPLLVVAGLP